MRAFFYCRLKKMTLEDKFEQIRKAFNREDVSWQETKSVQAHGKSASEASIANGLYFKQLRAADKAGLHILIPTYLDHVRRFEGATLLHMYHYSDALGLVMPDLAHGLRKRRRLQFDLKGSVTGRYTDTEIVPNSDWSTRMPLKDGNLRGSRVFFKTTVGFATFMGQIVRDVEMLSRVGMIDYSLFTILYVPTDEAGTPVDPRVKTLSSYGVELYDGKGSPKQYRMICGIIDALQPYDWRKTWEATLKNLPYPRSPKDLSSVTDPRSYAARFLLFVTRHFLAPANIKPQNPCAVYDGARCRNAKTHCTLDGGRCKSRARATPPPG